jgi:hypothetical protein
MSGAAFLQQYGPHWDSATSVDAAEVGGILALHACSKAFIGNQGIELNRGAHNAPAHGSAAPYSSLETACLPFVLS